MVDPKRCSECEFRFVDYTTSATGVRRENGLCRECHERNAARAFRGIVNGGRGKRTADERENVRETKKGVDR